MSNLNPLYLVENIGIFERKIHMMLSDIIDDILRLSDIANSFKCPKFISKYKLFINPFEYNEFTKDKNEKMYNRFIDIYNEMKSSLLLELKSKKDLLQSKDPETVLCIKGIINHLQKRNHQRLNQPFMFNDFFLNMIKKHINDMIKSYLKK